MFKPRSSFSMKHKFVFPLLLFFYLVACGPSKNVYKAIGEPWVAQDFTAENLFTTNIEGPKFDKGGNLYEVNFQKDGTIGKVNPDGTANCF